MVLVQMLLETFLYLECFYNQNDSLPYKAYFGPSSATYHFYYNNLGRLVKDSINNFGGSNLNLSRNLTYSGNKIFAQVYKTYLGTTNLVEKDTFLLDTRGNMNGTKYYWLTNSNNYELASSSNSTFDNAQSPLFKTPSYRIFSFTFGTMDFESHYNNFGVNNILVDIYNRHPFTGSSNTVVTSDTSSAVNIYYQNGLLKNVKSYRSTWTYMYKTL
jgi:hypothetical protein